VTLDNSKAVVILGVLLAIGMSLAALIFGIHAKQIGAGRQSITVKGLAEKPVSADAAEWAVGLRVQGPTFADTLAKLRAEKPALDAFLAAQGFAKEAMTDGNESVTPNMVEEPLPNGNSRTVQRGFYATQTIVVRSTDLARVVAANKAILQLEADGRPVTHNDPLFLVTTLEDVKMSLIGAATQNAQKRAEEFAKNGNARVGAMRSASQGSFYILPAGASEEASDYGGTYDKTTIDKLARVVVTIDYNIER
jgi:hypothetical protein